MQLYQIGKLIGTGYHFQGFRAFGDVFVCIHREDRKRYAAKRLNLAERDERGKENIENQLKMLQKFRHPNIVPFKDSFLTQKGLYIIMVYCDGGDMYTRIRNVKQKGKIFTQSQILDWFAQLALAIHYLHSKRIVHRDLKSQNLFLKIEENQKGQRIQRIRLGDFGIAKVLDENQDLTATSTGIGSPLYMSPQALDKNVYSYKSDIWSLGCIIYELCNLRTPFDAQSHFGLIRKVLHSSYPTILPTYSKQLRDLISKMLQKKANKRPSITQVINKPFIKARAQKYIRDTLQRADKTVDIDDVYLDSLREQAKMLQVPLPLPEENMFFKYPSLASIGDYDNKKRQNTNETDQVEPAFKKRRRTIYENTQSQETTFQNQSLMGYNKDKWAFTDNKRQQMMADNEARGKMKPIPKKIANRKEQLEQQMNIQRFKLIEDYPMDQPEQVEQSFEGIIEEEDQIQDGEDHSISLEFEESEIFPKEYTHLKLFNQIQLLKNNCQTGLGMHKFMKAYQLTAKGANKQTMIQALGEDQLGYWHLMEQALFYESILESTKKNEE